MHFMTAFDIIDCGFQEQQVLAQVSSCCPSDLSELILKKLKCELVSDASIWHYLVNLIPEMLVAAWGVLERGAVGRQEGVLPLASGP